MLKTSTTTRRATMNLRFADEDFVLLADRAMLWPRRRALLVADTHFGKDALVTGAAKGIGAAVAQRLGLHGARLALLDRDEEVLQQRLKHLTSEDVEARAFVVDVGLATDVERAVADAAAHFDGIDILSNNAGIQRYGTVETTPEEVWDEVLTVNVKSAYLLAHFTMPHLKKRRGSVVNMASVQAFATQRNVAAYTTSKHALIGLTKSMALDAAADGVRVNCVAPGSVDTPMLNWALSLDDNPDLVRREVDAMHPLGRIATAAEIAEVVAFLASERASFITGATLVADGGLLLPLGGEPKMDLS